MAMKIRLVKTWGMTPAGTGISPPEELARRLIDAGIAVALAPPSREECTAMAGAEETAVLPESKPRRRRGKEAKA